MPVEYDQILKERGGFWDEVNGGDLPEDLVLAARREEIDWVHSEGVHEIVPMQECEDASKKLLDLIQVDTDKSVTPQPGNSIETVCQGIQDEEVRQSSKNVTCFSVVLCNATS